MSSSARAVELLGHLTWPVEFDDEHMTINHHRHLPYIRLSQVRYKAALLTHASRPIRTAIKVSLPSIALQRPQRSSRDEGVIKLLLYFLRNLAIISFPKDVASDGSESEISRSATIESYQKENVFQLILTIASSLGDDFSDQDVIILETLFHLVKGINPESLFSNADSAANVPSEELQQALRQEKAAASRARKSAATRHNRFGTMMWLDRGQDKYSTLSGQRYLGDLQTSLRKVDLSKKWNKPTRTRVNPDESVQVQSLHSQIPATPIFF